MYCTFKTSILKDSEAKSILISLSKREKKLIVLEIFKVLIIFSYLKNLIGIFCKTA